MLRRFLALVVIALLPVGSALAQLPTPKLVAVFPMGARQGTSVEVELRGNDLTGAKKLHFNHPAITAELLPESKDKQLRFKINVPADLPPGEYDLRVVADLGITNPRTFVVSDVPEIAETEPNNERDKATRIEAGSAVNGRIGGGLDVDWFVFKATKGQRILIECLAWRIDSKLDGSMHLFDAQGKELASSEDEAVRDEKRDPLIDFDVPADGDYYLRFKDFTFAGGNEYGYRLLIGSQPYIDFVMPIGISPGVETPVTIYGRNLPGGEKTELKVQGRPLEKLVRPARAPANAGDGSDPFQFAHVMRPPGSPRIDAFDIRVGGPAGTSNAKLLCYGTASELVEAEPNNTPQTAMKLNAPCGVSGWFDVGDIDCFTIAVKKNQTYRITIDAERIGSPADPDLEILNSEGKVAANAQDDGQNIGQIRFDTKSRDITFLYNAIADGDYTLRLEHLYRQVQGGPQFYYRLKVELAPEPDFRVICQPPSENKMEAHTLYQNGRERLDMLVYRIGPDTYPITVEAKKLPPGVTAEPITIGPGMNWGTLVLSAAPDAQIGEAELEIVASAKIGEKQITRRARGGTIVWDTGNTAAISRMARGIMLALRPGAPFKLTLSAANATVEAGKPLEVSMKLERSPDMPSDVQLTGGKDQLPKGLTVPTTTIAAGQTEVKLTLETKGVKEGTYSFMINGDGQVPGKAADGKKSGNIRCVYPSNTITVTVTAPPTPAK